MKAFCFLGFICYDSQSIAAAFRNLDFQSPNPAFFSHRQPDGSFLVREVIPGWTLQTGDIIQRTMNYNSICLTCPSAQLLGPGNPRAGDTFIFSMKSGRDMFGNVNIPETIFQVGDVPSEAQSLLFAANFTPTIDPLKVFLATEQLPFIHIESGDYTLNGIQYHLYGADIREWADTTAELRFTVGASSFVDGAGGPLANIQFSPNPLPSIPEPSTWALLCTGLAAIVWMQPKQRLRQYLMR